MKELQPINQNVLLDLSEHEKEQKTSEVKKASDVCFMLLPAVISGKPAKQNGSKYRHAS